VTPFLCEHGVDVDKNQMLSANSPFQVSHQHSYQCHPPTDCRHLHACYKCIYHNYNIKCIIQIGNKKYVNMFDELCSLPVLLIGS